MNSDFIVLLTRGLPKSLGCLLLGILGLLVLGSNFLCQVAVARCGSTSAGRTDRPSGTGIQGIPHVPSETWDSGTIPSE